MLGYVTCEKAELKLREYELYTGYYCGICKYIGREYGQLPRMTLSYDAAFLAMVLASLRGNLEDLSTERCIAHPVKKKTIASNREIEYAGDVMLILAWYKFKDDAEDEGKVSAKVSLKLMRGIFNKLKIKHEKLCEEIERNLSLLNTLEKEKCSNLDKVSDAFAKTMESVFTMDMSHSPNEKKLLAGLGYHVGKWIYLMDALEDIEDNIESGAYNPLLYRYKFNQNEESQEDFRKRINNDCERNLYLCLAHMGKIIDLMEFEKNEDIIENIVYLGLRRQTETILSGGQVKDEKSL